MIDIDTIRVGPAGFGVPYGCVFNRYGQGVPRSPSGTVMTNVPEDDPYVHDRADETMAPHTSMATPTSNSNDDDANASKSLERSLSRSTGGGSPTASMSPTNRLAPGNSQPVTNYGPNKTLRSKNSGIS